ncbi:MAG: hypothetical protein P8X68_15960, partial [Desulfobacterales bacterium]
IPLTRLNVPLNIECFPLEGKTVSERAIAGRITHLGGNTAEGSLDEKVAVYTNLRILLADEENRGLSELYAKVLPNENPDTEGTGNRLRLQFTSMSQETKNYLEKKTVG